MVQKLKNEQFFRFFLEAMELIGNNVMITDVDGSIESVNSSFSTIFP